LSSEKPTDAARMSTITRSDLTRWFFEPGHAAAEFSARHMIVTNVRGHFKNVHGSLDFDDSDPRSSSVGVTIDARTIRTGTAFRQWRRCLARAE